MTTHFTINPETGAWGENNGLITNREACVIASSVLPGTTPEQVSLWYHEWLELDPETGESKEQALAEPYPEALVFTLSGIFDPAAFYPADQFFEVNSWHDRVKGSPSAAAFWQNQRQVKARTLAMELIDAVRKYDEAHHG